MNETTPLVAEGQSNPIRGRIQMLFSATFALLVTAVPASVDNTMSTNTDSSVATGAIQVSAVTEETPEFAGQVYEVAKDLRSPDGIARDVQSGVVYVSEEDEATIVRIKPNGARQVLFDHSTPVYEGSGATARQVAGLRSLEGLALDKKRETLYAVEDIPGGRLIAFDITEHAVDSNPCGRVIPLPIENSQFAWESVDVGPAGELLMAGSTMESAMSEFEKESGFGLFFRGAILYRDYRGEWWMPLNNPLVSYSAVCFSTDSNYAFFACEVPGDVGCLDLRTHNVRTFRMNKTFHSPEGVCALPGGAALVAEEPGKIYRLDPKAGTIQLLYDNKGTIESVCWDDTNHRLLVTDDQHGILVSLINTGLDFQTSHGTVQDIPFEEKSTPVEMIPDQCPKYLAKVLKLGGYDPRQMSGGLAFREFAKKYCLVAIDAEAMLLTPGKPGGDPIKRIQFVIVAPYLTGIQEGELIWSSSGFTAVKESGQVVKTELVQRQVIHGDLMEDHYVQLGGQSIALPVPFSARINTGGFVSVEFMGMGVMSDFYLILDTAEPSHSVMVVIQPDGSMQQYELHLPPNQDRSHWVIAMERKQPDVWRSLSFKHE